MKIDRESWLEFFDDNFFDNLNSKFFRKSFLTLNIGERGEGFRIVFDHLIRLNLEKYTIVETGTIRSLGSWGDGQSSKIFETFLKTFNGELHSVDISPESCSAAKSCLDSSICTVNCDDSVNFLKNFESKNNVNLFYLDSWDVDWKNDQASANHHLKEFLEIENFLSKDSLVVIDDNNFINKHNQRTGKGRKIFEYLSTKNIFPIFDKYQIIYKF